MAVFKKVFINNRQTAKDSHTQLSNLCGVKKILYEQNVDEIKDLIISKDIYLGPVLRMINMEGSEIEDLMSRRDLNKCFLNCVIEVEGGHPKAFLWLKRNVDYEICEVMISDFNYNGNFLQVVSDKLTANWERVKSLLTELVHKMCNRSIANWLEVTIIRLKVLSTIASMYLDLTLDSILLGTIMIVLGNTLKTYSLFSTQITVLLMTSIIVPILITAFSIAFTRPIVILSSENARNSFRNSSMFILRIPIILFCPMVPAIIMISSERSKEKRRALRDKHKDKDALIPVSDIERSELLSVYINETRLALLTFKRNELGIELIIQLSIHLTMVLLSQTKNPIESSLQTIFKSTNIGEEGTYKNTTTFLVLSLLWSFKTSVLTAIKIKTESKNFLPLLPKLVLGLRYFLVLLIRIGCIVTYFSSYIGLLGIMDHYQAEIILLDYETWMSFDKKLYQYWNPIVDEFQSTNISNLFRSQYTMDGEYSQAPSTTRFA